MRHAGCLVKTAPACLPSAETKGLRIMAIDYAPLHTDPSLPPLLVNLYSDTQTKPTPAMKAEVMPMTACTGIIQRA